MVSPYRCEHRNRLLTICFKFWWALMHRNLKVCKTLWWITLYFYYSSCDDYGSSSPGPGPDDGRGPYPNRCWDYLLFRLAARCRCIVELLLEYRMESIWFVVAIIRFYFIVVDPLLLLVILILMMMFWEPDIVLFIF